MNGVCVYADGGLLYLCTWCVFVCVGVCVCGGGGGLGSADAAGPCTHAWLLSAVYTGSS